MKNVYAYTFYPLVPKAAPSANVARFLQRISKRLGAKNDAALSRALEISPAMISKMRNGYQPVTSAIMLRVCEATQFSIYELREMIESPIEAEA